ATNVTYQDRIAAFGPRLTDEGLFGNLVSVGTIENEGDNQKGCNRLKKKYDNDKWIALIERGQCSFIDKVRNMQASGAIAVVVGDNEHNGLITMYATGDTSDVKIPSVFVAQTEYRDLKSLSLIAKAPRQRRKQDITPQQVVDNLPTKIFYRSKRQDNEPQECVICLEDFVDEVELKIMPCKHEYHVECIDSWLKTKRF
ncbi:20149_t:CDS:2, partial [Cetraspora pellucida]